MPGIMSDRWIRKMASERQMIWPFEPNAVKEVPVASAKGTIIGGPDGAITLPTARAGVRGVVSFGVSSYGYDMRVGEEFKVFKNTHCAEVDPKNVDERAFEEVSGKKDGFVRIPPNSFALANSVEEFLIPDDTLGIVLGKSTYARCGIICNVTPLEPGWKGFVTIEISNTTPLPARIWCNEGICQVLFFQAEERCEVSYADKKGKYQNQGRRPYLPTV